MFYGVDWVRVGWVGVVCVWGWLGGGGVFDYVVLLVVFEYDGVVVVGWEFDDGGLVFVFGVGLEVVVVKGIIV